jgi:zinc protease
MKARFLLTLLAACAPAAGPSPTKPAPTPAPPPVPTNPAVDVTPATATKAPPAKAQKVRSLEGITEYKLDNGLQVLLFPDQSQSTVTVNITYLVGSRLEGYGETGMAHLLEHMMFKGSPNHRNVLKLLEERGGQANGTTSYDRTNYYETLPATPENLDWTLNLESDRMRNASISVDDLKTEFSVVRNEFESGENQPTNILFERVSETAFLWHNYGKPTIGSKADIERVPTTTLHAFYDKYYQPDNAMLIVSGKFDEATALAKIEQMFGSIPRPTRKLGDAYTVEPAQDGERIVTLRRSGDVFVVAMAYHTVSGASPDHAASEAAADILTHEASGRLYKKLVETKLAAQIFGWDQSLHDPYLAQFGATVRDAKNVDKVEKIMIEEIEGLGNSKIEGKEVERWRTAQLKELELAMANSQEIALIMSEMAAIGDWRMLFAYRDQLKKITAADVQRVAKAYFRPSNRTLGRFIPTKDVDRAPLTETTDVAGLVKNIQAGAPQEQGEVFAATLDNIEARTKRGELKGGIKTALLAKKTRGGKVEFSLRLHWGDAKALQGKSTAGNLLGAMLSRGTAKKSHEELQDLEDQLKAHIWIASEADGMTLHIETLRDKLGPSIDLAAEMLTTPGFPDKELEIVRQEQLANLEQQLKDPMSTAFSALQQLTEKWPKGDPRYPMTAAEQIDEVKKVRLGDIKQFYKDFAGVGHGELVIVGDFDPAAVSAQVEKLLSGWQSKKPYARLETKAWGVAGQQKSIDIKDKEMTTIALGQDVAMKDSDPDYPAWLMLSQVLGGDTGSRAWNRLRENEGLSYGVATWANADAEDAAGSIGGYAIVAPKNLAKAKASLLDEIQKIVNGKITDAELKRAQAAWIKDQDTSLSNDNYVVSLWVKALFHGRTTSFTKDLRAKIQAVTTADVERVAKKWLDPKRLTVVDAGDTSKAK